MAGSLIKIDEEIVTSAVASVTLTGIDSTYDVYMVKFSDVTFSGIGELFMQVTSSGTPVTTTTYGEARVGLFADTTFQKTGGTYNKVGMAGAIAETTTGSIANGIIYLFNFNNSSEYNFGTYETNYRDTSSRSRGYMGGFSQTTAQSSDGVHFLNASSVNFTNGTFTLYGLKK